MARIAPPALPLADFEMWWDARAGTLVNPYTGAVLRTVRRAGRWAGRVAWGTAGDTLSPDGPLVSQRANERTLLAFRAALQGRDNEVDIVLPGKPFFGFQPDLPPAATAAVTGVAADDAGVRLTIALTNAGVGLEVGNCFRYDDTLYMVNAGAGGVYTVTPDVQPPGAGAATVQAVTVRARLDATGRTSPRGPGGILPMQVFDWTEV